MREPVITISVADWRGSTDCSALGSLDAGAGRSVRAGG
jgi:hypothetical protein